MPGRKGVLTARPLHPRFPRKLSFPEEEIAQFRAEAGRLLLNDGVAGLKDLLEEASVAPLTFDQETQVQSVWEAHDRERRRVIEADVEVAGSSLSDNIRDLEEQLLLAAVKFLNPAQRYALTRDIAGERNSDLPEDEDELREYLGDLRSPAGRGGGLVIDGFGGGRMPNRDEDPGNPDQRKLLHRGAEPAGSGADSDRDPWRDGTLQRRCRV